MGGNGRVYVIQREMAASPSNLILIMIALLMILLVLQAVIGVMPSGMTCTLKSGCHW